MAGELVFLFSMVLIVGVLTQWVAWRLHLPPILLMLIGGLVAGPLMGWLNPDAVLGALLQPVVAIGVAVILFEGGMTLRWRDLRGMGRVLFLLVSLGVAVTWIVAASAAHLFLGIGLQVAALIGAILTVSGPTVVGPLLNHIRPRGAVASVLKWEGIVIDPIGALLAVFVFLAIRAGGVEEATVTVLTAVATAAFVGVVAGLAGALVLVVAIARYWIPDHLHNAVALGLMLLVFLAADAALSEAGLVAVTVMGVALANQRWAPMRRILEFKETLRLLIIPALFILLAARLTRGDLDGFGLPAALFLAALVFVARPLAVWLSTLRSRLSWRERSLLAGVMPRGIVAAAVASVLALDLEEAGFEGAGMVVPVTFLAIIGTVVVYGLGGRPLARLLRVAREGTGDVLMIGAGAFSRAFAAAMHKEGVGVELVDTNASNVTAANVDGLQARHMDALSEVADETLDLERVDHVLAMTPNDQANQLLMVRYGEHVGRARAFHLHAPREGPGREAGRMLFGAVTWTELNRRVAAGHYVVRTRLSDVFTMEDWRGHHGEGALPLALLRASGRIDFYAQDARPEPAPGDTLLGLVPPERSDEGRALDNAPTPAARVEAG